MREDWGDGGDRGGRGGGGDRQIGAVLITF